MLCSQQSCSYTFECLQHNTCIDLRYFVLPFVFEILSRWISINSLLCSFSGGLRPSSQSCTKGFALEIHVAAMRYIRISRFMYIPIRDTEAWVCIVGGEGGGDRWLYMNTQQPFLILTYLSSLGLTCHYRMNDASHSTSGSAIHYQNGAALNDCVASKRYPELCVVFLPRFQLATGCFHTSCFSHTHVILHASCGVNARTRSSVLACASRS